MSKPVILFLAANPVGSDPLALTDECAAIERELSATPGRDDFEFRSKWAVTVDELMHHLNEHAPTVIHVSGHGGAAGLALQTSDGKAQLVTAKALTMIVKATAGSARLVVLNACYSAEQAEALRTVVDCVVGMSGVIDEAEARTFAKGFYGALGYRRSVAVAVEQGIARMAGHGLTFDAPRCQPRDGVDAKAMFLSGGAAAHVVAPPRTAAPPPAAAPTAANSTAANSMPRPPAGASDPVRFDLFLAHPSSEKPAASALYDLLQPDVRVFLDARSLQPGDRWDREIPAAQRAARATVVLVSSKGDAAWYLGDEIVSGIEAHRAAPGAHLLVPVVLEPGVPLPFGLRGVHAIDVAAVGGLVGVAAQLRQLVARFRDQPATPPVVPTRPAATAVDARALYDRLLKVTDALFEQIVFLAGVDRSLVSARTAPLSERALDVSQLAALDAALGARVAEHLDRRAPWTRA